jgi:Divergent InlB B-repeat domain/Chitobiase/beta-hexosaminidase C-terminal domain
MGLTAYFAPTQALETLTYGSVSRLAPVGMPAVFVDGAFIVESNASARGSAAVSLSTTFANGPLLFTLDGSTPDFSSRYFAGPFEVKRSSTLRAVAYNSDFTQSQQSDPVEIIILPTLNAHAAGGGSVSVDPPAGAYFADGTATVTATPAPGWTFLKWLGDASGTNLTASVSMSRNRCVQAVFGTPFGVTTVGSGSVVTSPVMDLYPYGSGVRLTAVPQAGNYFVFWGNAATGTNNPLTYTITIPNATASAVFTPLPTNSFSLSVIADGLGRVTATPRANRYTIGTNVTLTALPDAGQDFVGWSGDATGTNNPLSVMMSASRVITALFTKRPRLLVTPCLDGFSDGGFRFTLQGEVGAIYRIDSATVLPDWTMHGMFTNALGTDQITDPSATNDLRRFYRVERVPLLQ